MSITIMITATSIHDTSGVIDDIATHPEGPG
jgi:hypothetical protein